MIRVLPKILFTLVMVFGLSLGVFAQKGGQDKRPPKDPPPVINPAPTKPPPKKDDKRKRSSAEFALVSRRSPGVWA